MSKIITIGREFGSGGRELGKRLAQKMQIAYYDSEIVSEIVKKSNLAEDYVNQVLENNIVRYFPITVSHTFSVFDYPQIDFENKVYTAQNETILSLAEKSDCVIVGRCADYILKDKNPFRIFVYADMDSKIKRCIEKGEAEEKKDERSLKQKIKKVDRSRASYYEFFTGLKWGDKKNYDLCVNTTNQSIKDIADEIASICDIYFKD